MRESGRFSVICGNRRENRRMRGENNVKRKVLLEKRPKGTVSPCWDK